MGVARMLVGLRYFEAGIARQAVVAARLVVDRANQGRLVHPLRHQRQMLANLDAGRAGGDRLEFAARLPAARPGFRSNMSCVAAPPSR